MPIFCNRCCAQVGPAYNFCAHCGAPLYPSAALHPPAAVAVAPATRIVIAPAKSVGLALLLTFFFGPFGLFYANAPLALLLLVLAIPAMVLTGGLAFFLIWAGSVVAAVISVNDHNQRVLTCAAVRC